MLGLKLNHVSKRGHWTEECLWYLVDNRGELWDQDYYDMIHLNSVNAYDKL